MFTKSKISPKSYEQAQKEFVELYAKPNVEKHSWKNLAFIESVVILILLSGYVGLSQKAETVPYIVEVDTIGRAKTIGYAVQTDISDEKIIKAFLYRFLDKSRSVITDGSALKKNLTEVYRVVTPGVRSNILDPFYRKDNPFELAKSIQRQIEPVSFLRESENTYLIEWKETERDLESKIKKEKPWKALITITQGRQNTAKEVEENPLNPFGIYIVALSWNELH